MNSSTDSLAAFIRAIPKTETHLHIEGALPYELLREMDPAKYPENPPFRRQGYRYPSFPEFERTLLAHAVPWFTNAERYHAAAKAIFAGLVAQNVRYVETSFHLPMTGFIGTPGREIVAAIKSAAPRGLAVRVFAGMLRSDYNGPLRATIDELHTWEELTGVDLHGDEAAPTQAWTAPIWARMRAAGKVTKCHAGEFGGAERVREAIEELGVLRIQHGTRAIEDPAVVRLAAERGATFDMCSISNVSLQVVPSIAAHPIRRYMDAGIRCTLSTDDPLCFANTVTGEYMTLATEAGFSRKELACVARAGWEIADMPEADRKAAFAEIERETSNKSGIGFMRLE